MVGWLIEYLDLCNLRKVLLIGVENVSIINLIRMRRLFILMSVVLMTVSVKAQEAKEWGDWTSWGQLSDSTYINPIIPSDYSDLDCIRVEDDYYAISSTMQFSPGMTLLHSRDLVNWEITTNVIYDLSQIGPELTWAWMNRPARGVWAGTLRYHEGRFYVFFGTPDEGYFMTSAAQPEGPWEPLTCILAEPGWDDCTVAWDEDGNACFVGTNFADGYKTYLFRMAADGKAIDKASAKLINQGRHREANKLIKVGEWWYLIFSEHVDGIGRYVMAKRSRNMIGPYDQEKQLALASWDAHEPNQGGIVQGKDDNWYFLTHHGRGDWSGRIVSLLPVTWVEGWPIIGEVVPENIGTMKWSGAMPARDEIKLCIRRSDDFDDGSLAPQWQWNYQPRDEMFSLTERYGWLRLKAFCPLKTNILLKAGNTLTQRTFRTPSNCVTIKMDISHMEDGQKAGLCHFSSKSSALGVVQENGHRFLEFRLNDQETTGMQLNQPYIWLQSRWGLEGKSQFYYSLDGDVFYPFGEVYQLVWGHYRGDRIGIYNFNDLQEVGWVDIDYLHYE